MKNNEKNHYVYMVLKRNERGITYISMLLSIVVIMITLPLLIHFYSYVDTQKLNDDLIVQQFFVLVRNDILASEYVDYNQNILYCHLITGEVARIEQYQDVIRRRVDARGHEIYMRNVESFALQPVSYGINISITTKDGEEYEKTIANYH